MTITATIDTANKTVTLTSEGFSELMRLGSQAHQQALLDAGRAVAFPQPIAAEQRRLMFALAREVGIESAASRHDLSTMVVGRRTPTWTVLTEAEASKVIDALGVIAWYKRVTE